MMNLMCSMESCIFISFLFTSLYSIITVMSLVIFVEVHTFYLTKKKKHIYKSKHKPQHCRWLRASFINESLKKKQNI